MKTLCKYAVLRFMPFAETQEFANIGIVISAPKLRFMDFKLAPSRLARITDFFEDVDGLLYKNAITQFATELNRVQILVQKFADEEHLKYFSEVTRFRESVIHFSEVHTLLCDNPADMLNQLYERYVGRQFVTKQYREAQMVKALRQTLNTNTALKFKERELQADYVSVKLPLVAEINKNIRAIKPLTFQQTKALALLEHGETWIGRVHRLIKTGRLDADHLMFTVEAPTRKGGKLEKAFNEVVTGMGGLGVVVSSYEEKEAIVKFAASDLSSNNYKMAAP